MCGTPFAHSHHVHAADPRLFFDRDIAPVQEALAKALMTTAVPSNLTPKLAAAEKDWPHDRGCVQQYREVALPDHCVFGDPHATRTVAISDGILSEQIGTGRG